MSATADYESLNTLVSNLKTPMYGSLTEAIVELEKEHAKLLEVLALQEKKALLEAKIADLKKKVGENLPETKEIPSSPEVSQSEPKDGSKDGPKSFSEVAAKVAPEKSISLASDKSISLASDKSISLASDKSISLASDKSISLASDKSISLASEKQEKPIAKSAVEKLKNKKQNKKEEKHVSLTGKKSKSDKQVYPTTEKDENMAAIYPDGDVLKVVHIPLGQLHYMTMIEKLQVTTPKSEGGWGPIRKILGPGYSVNGQKYQLAFHAADFAQNGVLGIIERDGARVWVAAHYKDDDTLDGVDFLTPIIGTTDFKIGEFSKDVVIGEILFPFNYAEFSSKRDYLFGIWQSKSVLEMLSNPDDVWNARLSSTF